MMIIEMREAAYDKAFGLLDEIKDLGKKKRMVLCELEDAIYECYEASKDSKEEYEEYTPESESETASDMDYRRRNAYRSAMRHNMHEYDDEDEDMQMRGYRRRSGMRMRGNRQGRYSY